MEPSLIRPASQHVFQAPGFYRVGVTVNNGLLSDLAWREFYVVGERTRMGHGRRGGRLGLARSRSRRCGSPMTRVHIAGASSVHASVDPYSGMLVNLLYPAIQASQHGAGGQDADSCSGSGPSTRTCRPGRVLSRSSHCTSRTRSSRSSPRKPTSSVPAPTTKNGKGGAILSCRWQVTNNGNARVTCRRR